MKPGGKTLVATLALGLLASMAPAAAQELKTWRKAASYDDVKFDLTNAITNRGLVIDANGNVGAMLERTGKDVGSTRPIYKAAEYFAFCSAKLSRDMMEADAGNLGFCPYVMFVYEMATKPGEIVVGFRRIPAAGDAASQKALAAVESLLEGIAREAVK